MDRQPRHVDFPSMQRLPVLKGAGILTAKGDGDIRVWELSETRRGVGARLRATCEHGTGYRAHAPAADSESRNLSVLGRGEARRCAKGFNRIVGPARVTSVRRSRFALRVSKPAAPRPRTRQVAHVRICCGSRRSRRRSRVPRSVSGVWMSGLLVNRTRCGRHSLRCTQPWPWEPRTTILIRTDSTLEDIGSDRDTKSRDGITPVRVPDAVR